MKIRFALGVVIYAVIFATQTQASALDFYFEVLKRRPVDYVVNGAVCEQVARLEVMQEYQEPEFETVVGVVYGHKSAAIGELDIVVLDRASNRVVMVAEVKCWDNLYQAHEKAAKQRERFIKALQVLPQMFLKSGERSFSRDQFREVQVYKAISQRGGQEFGFEMELAYSLEELMALRLRLLQCQKEGLCASPLKNN